MSINKVILVGNVGKDPVVRYFDKGVAKATFPLATSDAYKNQQGETITSTEWHNIVLWRSLAEVAEKTVKKGTQLYVVGKIRTRSYVDKDGNNKYITEILADTMLVLEKKQGAGNSPEGYRTSSQEKGSAPEISEPGQAYQAKSGGTDTYDNQGGPFNDVPGTGQSDDDLPF